MEGGSSRRFSAGESRAVHLTGVAHAATHYVELTYPTLAVTLAADSGVPLQQVLSWSFAGYLLFGLGALPAGMLADRIGARRVIVLGLAGSAAFAVLAGLAAPGRSLGLCFAGLGLFASFYHPAGLGLLSRVATARGRALAINGIYGNFGIALTPVVTAAACGAVGWRWTLAGTGIALAAVALVFHRVPIPERPPVRTRTGPVHQGRATSRAILAFGLLCVAAMLGGISYRGNTVVQPAFFAERISVVGYGVATSGAMLLGVAGQYLGGFVADRFELRRSYFAFHLASLPLLVSITALHQLPLLVASGFFVFFALGMQPIENSLYAQLTPERWRSTAYGLKFVFTFGVGALAVEMVPWAVDAGGLAGVYWMLTAVVGALLLAILALGAVTAWRPASPPAPEPALATGERGIHTPSGEPRLRTPRRPR